MTPIVSSTFSTPCPAYCSGQRKPRNVLTRKTRVWRIEKIDKTIADKTIVQGNAQQAIFDLLLDVNVSDQRDQRIDGLYILTFPPRSM